MHSNAQGQGPLRIGLPAAGGEFPNPFGQQAEPIPTYSRKTRFLLARILNGGGGLEIGNAAIFHGIILPAVFSGLACGTGRQRGAAQTNAGPYRRFGKNDHRIGLRWAPIQGQGAGRACQVTNGLNAHPCGQMAAGRQSSFRFGRTLEQSNSDEIVPSRVLKKTIRVFLGGQGPCSCSPARRAAGEHGRSHLPDLQSAQPVCISFQGRPRELMWWIECGEDHQNPHVIWDGLPHSKNPNKTSWYGEIGSGHYERRTRWWSTLSVRKHRRFVEQLPGHTPREEKKKGWHVDRAVKHDNDGQESGRPRSWSDGSGDVSTSRF